MRYYISKCLSKEKLKELHLKGIYYCYIKKEKNNIIVLNESAENSNILLTDKELVVDGNTINYILFSKNNTKVKDELELIKGKELVNIIHLDTDLNVLIEFDKLFSTYSNFNELDILPLKEKKENIIDYYKKDKKYDIITNDNQIYYLYRFEKFIDIISKKELIIKYLGLDKFNRKTYRDFSGNLYKDYSLNVNNKMALCGIGDNGIIDYPVPINTKIKIVNEF